MSRVTAAVALTVFTLTFTACSAPGNDAEPSSETETAEATSQPSPAAEPEPEPETPAEPAPVVMPGCLELLPVEQVQSVPGLERFEPASIEWFPQLGPAATTAFDGALQFQRCDWGIPSTDIVAYLIVAELGESERIAFTDALDNSDFVRTENGDIRTYFLENAIPETGLNWWYSFYGNIVVGEFSHHSLPVLADSTLQAMIAANTIEP